MPPALIPILAIAADIGTTAAATAGLLGATFTATSWAVAAGAIAGLAVSTIGMAIVGQPSSNQAVPAPHGIAIIARSAVMPRQVVFGRAKLSGLLAYATSTNVFNVSVNGNLWNVIAFAGHQIQSYDGFYINDQFFDSTSQYFPNTTIFQHLGAASQTVDTNLQTAAPSVWTSSHQGNGVAYIIAKYLWDRNIFSAGQPNIAAVIRGANEIFDPRTSTTGWTNNAALCLRHYLVSQYGLRATSAQIDDTSFIAAANICDEIVSTTSITWPVAGTSGQNLFTFTSTPNQQDISDLDQVSFTTSTLVPIGNYFWVAAGPKTGHFATTLANARAGTFINATSTNSDVMTRLGQPRYTCDGVFTLDRNRIDILNDLLATCVGDLIWQGGKYVLFAGAYQSPIGSLNEDNLRGAIQVRVHPSKRDMFNAVRAAYVATDQNWQTTQAPIISNALFKSQDGDSIIKDIQLAMVLDTIRVQRIATLVLNRSRLGITLNFPANWSALKFACRDNIQVSIASMGWVNKEFIITDWTLATGGGVDLILQEENSAAYVWNNGMEIATAFASGTNLPALNFVAAPTGLFLTTGTSALFVRQDGTVFSRILVSWNASIDGFVISGGIVNIQYKKNSDTVWIDAPSVAGNQTSSGILDVQDGVSYDVQVRFENIAGVVSAWTQQLNTAVVGKQTPPADVTLLRAEQNGDTVVFQWTEVTDLDLKGYEIRYMNQGQVFVFSQANPLTGAQRGAELTTASMPPGSWTVGIKAIDTSGNFSNGTATSSVTVINNNDLLFQRQEATAWTGTISGFVVHWTGVLIPDSTELANVRSNYDIFDNYVVAPVAICTYTAAAFGWTFSDFVRAWGVIDAIPGPGQSNIGARLQINYSLSNGIDPLMWNVDPTTLMWNADPTTLMWVSALSGWLDWTIGTISANFAQHRIYLDTTLGLPVIRGFQPSIDIPPHLESAQGVTIAPGGTVVVFPKPFQTIPAFTVTANGTSALIATYDSLTFSQARIHVFTTAGTDVGGTVNWTASTG